jgi:hypothetical protein
MKNIILSIFVTLLTNSATALNKVPISVFVPPSNVLTESNRQTLFSKLQNVITQVGYSSDGNSEQFVCYSKVVLLESQKIEGGMKTILQNNYDFNFFIKDLKSNTTFSSLTKSISGSGYSNELAAKNAIINIKSNDQDLLNFVNLGVGRILKYYSDNCNSIIMESRNLMNLNRHEEALYLLTSVPRANDTCYSKVLQQTTIVIKKFMEVNCKQQLALANTFITNNQIEQGMKILAGVAGVSVCDKEWNDLKNRAEALMDIQQKNAWKFIFQQQKNDFELSQARAECARDIAVAYYSNRPPVYNYNIIVW